MEHPTVMPAAARVSMLAAWTLPSVSPNSAGDGAGASWNARTKKLAICARVTEWLGQYRGGPVAHPAVIPRSASCSA